MSNLFKTMIQRARAKGLSPIEEIEQFGANGEEAVCRLLRKHFQCVKRNIVVPHKDLFLEKDLFVVCDGVPFVLEIKNWKGEIGIDGSDFYQLKDNGVRKKQKNPVGTTNQFLRCMKGFYRLEIPVWSAVVFVDADCRLKLPEEIDGVALLPVEKLVSYIRKRAKETPKSYAPIDVNRLLFCTRFYSEDSEFCKGILADSDLECTAEDGSRVRLDTTRIAYITVEHQPLRLRDKLYVTFFNGKSGVFYNRDARLTVGCLDGSYKTIALNRIKHIVF